MTQLLIFTIQSTLWERGVNLVALGIDDAAWLLLSITISNTAGPL